MSIQFIDAVFAIIILGTAVTATLKGFIYELFSKLAFILGLFLSILFYGKLAPYMLPYITVPVICNILSFVIIFILVYLIMRLVQQLVKSVFDGEVMNGLDHSLGFLFGVFEGLVIVCFILLVFYTQPWFPLTFLEKSFFSNLLDSFIMSSTEYVKGISTYV